MYQQFTSIDQLPASCIEALQALPEELRNASITHEIILEIYNGWPGKTGEDRVREKMALIALRVPQYAAVMGKTHLEFLTVYAAARQCNYTNWFNESRLPDLSEVMIFENTQEFIKRFPSGKSICPACGGESTDFQECNTGKVVDKKGNVCDWKAYGLFRTMGKGIQVILKDKIEGFPSPVTLFKPIELLQSQTLQSTNRKRTND